MEFFAEECLTFVQQKSELRLGEQDAVRRVRRAVGTGESLSSAAATAAEPQEDPRGKAAALVTPQKKKIDMTSIRCYNCQQLGHYASQCPQRSTAAKGTVKVAKAAAKRARKAAKAQAKGEATDPQNNSISTLAEGWGQISDDSYSNNSYQGDVSKFIGESDFFDGRL